MAADGAKDLCTDHWRIQKSHCLHCFIIVDGVTHRRLTECPCAHNDVTKNTCVKHTLFKFATDEFGRAQNQNLVIRHDPTMKLDALIAGCCFPCIENQTLLHHLLVFT